MPFSSGWPAATPLALAGVCSCVCACAAANVQPVQPASARPRVVVAAPLTGDPNDVDGWGYPRATADKAALAALLRVGRHAELTAHVEELQRAFEADWRREYWPTDAIEAFPPDDALAEPFGAWVASAPASFAPYAARGAWLVAIARELRAVDWADGARTAFGTLDDVVERARVDLDRALELRPSAVAVSRELLVLARLASDVTVGRRQVLAGALAQCPECLDVRAAYIAGLRPRAGGSLDEMDRFARDTAKGNKNRRLKVLAGYSLQVLCELEKDPRSAVRLCDAAIAWGDASDFYEVRAGVRAQLGNLRGRLADLTRAIELRPQSAPLYARRAFARLDLGETEGAVADMQTALAIDGHSARVVGDRSTFVNVLWARAQGEGTSPERARALLVALLAIEPRYEQARARLEALQGALPKEGESR